MDTMNARRDAEYLERVTDEKRSDVSLLTLIGLHLIAFSGAALLALIVPDALDAAASSANESARVFAVAPPGATAREVLNPITAPPR